MQVQLDVEETHLALVDRVMFHQREVDPAPVLQVMVCLVSLVPVLVVGDLGLGQLGVSILVCSEWTVRPEILHGRHAQPITTVGRSDTL